MPTTDQLAQDTGTRWSLALTDDHLHTYLAVGDTVWFVAVENLDRRLAGDATVVIAARDRNRPEIRDRLPHCHAVEVVRRAVALGAGCHPSGDIVHVLEPVLGRLRSLGPLATFAS